MTAPNTTPPDPAPPPPSTAPHTPLADRSPILRVAKALVVAVEHMIGGLNRVFASWKWYGENGDLKILAAVVACVLFFNIRGREGLASTKEIALPLRVSVTQHGKTVLDFYASDKDGAGYAESGTPFRIINSEEFFSLEHKLPKTVRVRFEGSPEIIRGLAENPASHIAVEIDKVPRYGSMLTEKIPFSGVRDIGNLSGVRVVSIDPPHVRLAWDDEVMKDVSEIKIPLVGEPFGGAHTEVENLYGDIRLTGSKRMFERLNESGWVVSTESIDVSRRTMDFIETVKIDIPSDSGITRVEPTHFNVRVRFKTSNGSKSSVSGPDIPVEHAEELPEETTEPDPNTNAVSHFD